MMLRVGHLYATLEAASPTERAWLVAYLTPEDDKARYRKSAQPSLFNQVAQAFPAGLVPLVRARAQKDGHSVDVVDVRKLPCQRDAAADLAWLRDYQLAAVDAACSHKRGVLWLPTGCLAGDTRVIVRRGDAAYVIELRSLVDALEGRTIHENRRGDRQWDADSEVYTLSMDEEGWVTHNRIVRGWRNGLAEVFALTTESGRTIRATAAHRFRTPEGYVPLGDLGIGDDLCCYEWGPRYRQKLRVENYPQQAFMQSHPHKVTRYSRRDGGRCSVPVHRLVAEARLNGLSYAEFIGRLVLGEVDGLHFINPQTHHVHHVDLNPENNHPNNLEVLTVADHNRLHHDMKAQRRADFRSGNILLDRVKRITPCGVEEVFDLECESPRNNYVPNEFVTHNSGKTEVAVGLTRALPCRWLFVVHRTNLLEQTAQRYELRASEHAAAGSYVGPVVAARYGEGRLDDPRTLLGCRFVVATFQTLLAKVKQRDPLALYLLKEWAEGLQADEAHTLPATNFWALAMNCNAVFRFGLSGTPLDRGDKRSLFTIAATGPVIARVRASDLIARGVLARPTVRMVRVQQTASWWEYAQFYAESVVNSRARNQAIVDTAIAARGPMFIFVRIVEHGRWLTDELNRAGVRAAFVSGDKATKLRLDAIARLNQGEFDALVVTSVFQEGVDVPGLRTVINATAAESVIATLQNLGRGMRAERDAAGTVTKSTFDVYDIADAGCGCDKASWRGERHFGCKWFEKHTRARRTAYTREGLDVIDAAPPPARAVLSDDGPGEAAVPGDDMT